MGNYPIIEQRSLPKAQRGAPWGIGFRSRSASDIPLPNAHEAVVYKSGGSYVIDDGRSRLDDDHVRNATNITVVDMRVKAPVLAQLTIPARGGAEFTVQVTFQCTVRRPEVVVESGLHDLEGSLTQYLRQHQPLHHVGEEFELSDVNEVRRDVNAAVRAYVMLRPPDYRGIDVEVGSVEVLTPEDYAEFEEQRLKSRREGQLSSEEQQQKHFLEQENEQLLHLRNAERQQFSQQLSAQASVNKQALDEMRQRYEDTLAQMRQQSTHTIQSKQVHHDQTIEADSFRHQQGLRSAAIDGAIDGAQRLAAAMGAEQSEISGLLPTAAGENSMAEAHGRLTAGREHQRQVEADDQLRRETWEHERERQESAWDRSDKRLEWQSGREDTRLKWQSEREVADRQFNAHIAELQARVDVISAGIARGMVDHQSLDKVLGTLSGMVKQLQNVAADKPADETGREGSQANERTVKGDVVSNTFEPSSDAFQPSSDAAGPEDAPLREEDYFGG
jgi:hypothetical protein